MTGSEVRVGGRGRGNVQTSEGLRMRKVSCSIFHNNLNSNEKHEDVSKNASTE